jgi:hypothetical protein
VAKKRNYREECRRAEAKIAKLTAAICKKSYGLAWAESLAEPTDCEDAEALVATWESAARDANDILMASMNVATEVNVGLQASYALRAVVCPSI